MALLIILINILAVQKRIFPKGYFLDGDEMYFPE
jgi:hypothetical protein